MANKKSQAVWKAVMEQNSESNLKGGEAMSIFETLYLLLTLASVVIAYLAYKRTKKK